MKFFSGHTDQSSPVIHLVRGTIFLERTNHFIGRGRRHFAKQRHIIRRHGPLYQADTQGNTGRQAEQQTQLTRDRLTAETIEATEQGGSIQCHNL